MIVFHKLIPVIHEVVVHLPPHVSVLVAGYAIVLKWYERSRNKTAQMNEVLLKVLCHNICVLIQEMAELGIEPEFVIGG